MVFTKFVWKKGKLQYREVLKLLIKTAITNLRHNRRHAHGTGLLIFKRVTRISDLFANEFPSTTTILLLFTLA
jgi:hypothetical protein